MKIDFSKIKLPRFGFKDLPSLTPQGLWNGLLWFLVFAVLLVMIFDGWIYFHFLNASTGSAGHDNSPKTQSLRRALERMESKKKNSESHRSGFIIEDPS